MYVLLRNYVIKKEDSENKYDPREEVPPEDYRPTLKKTEYEGREENVRKHYHESNEEILDSVHAFFPISSYPIVL